MPADDAVTAKLAEWETLTNAATEGPWAVEENDYGEHAVYQDEGEDAFGTAYIAQELRQGHDEGRADAEFIAHARQMVPALLAFAREVLYRHAPVTAEPDRPVGPSATGVVLHTTCAYDGKDWPCPDAEAAQKHLGGEQ